MKKRPSPNGKSKTRVFNVRLEESVLDRVRELAEAEHRTATNLVQVFVVEGIARRESRQA